MSALIEMLVLAGFLVKCYVNSSSEMDNLKKVFSQDHCVNFFFNYMNQSFSTKILIGMVKDAIHCQIICSNVLYMHTVTLSSTLFLVHMSRI